MKQILYLIMIGFLIVAGCTSCVKNECKATIKPISMNEYSLTVINDDGTRYSAKDIYVFNQLKVGDTKLVTYIDGNPKMIVTVY